MTEIKEGDLRVWWISPVPREPTWIPVRSKEEAAAVIYGIAEAELRNDEIASNAFGLCVWEDGEWTEWYDDDTGEDVDAFIQDLTRYVLGKLEAG